MKYQVHTFGCKVNTYDSGLLQKRLGESAADGNHVHILNTCAVTAEASKEAVRVVRRIKSKDPLATVVVTGCAAQVDTGHFSDLPGVDLVIANSHKGQMNQIIEQFFKGNVQDKVFKSNIFRKEDLELGGGEEQKHTRSFLKIQDGCNSFCSYCIIPYARGKSRSIPVFDIIQKINSLHQSGVQEVVITGIHIADYFDDSTGSTLDDLVEKILKNTRIPRIRISSLEPGELTDRLLEMYSDERLCPHFHLSIQSANTKVLKDMKRRYDQALVKNVFERIQNKLPHAYIGMDVIVGFPTETDADFEETYELLKNSFWSKIHVFPYSERPGTKAAVLMGSVPQEVRVRRAKKLRELSEERMRSLAMKQKDTVKKVLVLKNSGEGKQTLARDYWNVDIAGAEAFLDHWANQEVHVQIKEVIMPKLKNQDPYLVGEVMT